MCTGGRVKHHLKNNADNPNSTILFVGYQAFGTLGRQILEKPDTIRIFGEEHPLKARVEKISGFSAHADREELNRWISSLKTPPRKIFVTHGEEKSAAALGAFLTEQHGWNCVVPDYGQEVVLD